MTASPARPLDDPPTLTCSYLSEPELEFGGGATHIDPKFGITEHGPKSLREGGDPHFLRVGCIGTAEGIETARTWMENAALHGVEGNKRNLPFPGYRPDRGFRSKLIFSDEWHEQIYTTEMDNVIRVDLPALERFEAAHELLETKLRLLSNRDSPPDYVVVIIPNRVFDRCGRTTYQDPHLGEVTRDLRRAFKASAMKYKIPTQLLKRETADGNADEHKSRVAWNFFTGLHYKAGHQPWGPKELQPGTCYLGISFYRPLGSNRSTMQISATQAFDEYGDGLVLRGPDFTWNPSKHNGTKAPHLPEEKAYGLVRTALERYEEEMRQAPRRVVVHKSSEYWPEETAGIRAALGEKVRSFDLLALRPQTRVRLLPANKYPPLRGTRFQVGDHDYLYTTGYIPEIRQFHSPHVPAPLRITDHIGYDTSREMLLREVLTLTKMNWNSAEMASLKPITLEFSSLVGEILKEIPVDEGDPLTNYKYYM